MGKGVDEQGDKDTAVGMLWTVGTSAGEGKGAAGGQGCTAASFTFSGLSPVWAVGSPRHHFQDFRVDFK